MEKFVQIHFLTSFPAALLNRDDVGFAKRVPFGGVTRTRISSQCLKRHWRSFDGCGGLGEIDAPRSVRSRATFEKYVFEPLMTEGVNEEMARAATEALMAEVLGESKKAKSEKKKGDEEGTNKDDSLRTGQLTVLGRPELDYMLTLARQAVSAVSAPNAVKEELKRILGKSGTANFKALRCTAGLDAALFGRMVTSDILARCDAAVHVAHAFTVHGEAAETDYFSALDDLLRNEEDEKLGSAHIGTSELTSGLYYGYVAIDLPLLVSNIEGCHRQDWRAADRTLAAQAVGRLLNLVATVSPGAKLGSTAPYSYASMLVVEHGDAQPRSLANAFLRPVKEQPDVLHNAYSVLASHIGELDVTYTKPAGRLWMAMGPTQALESTLGANARRNLADLIKQVESLIGG